MLPNDLKSKIMENQKSPKEYKELEEKFALTILSEIDQLQRGNFIRDVINIVALRMKEEAEMACKAFDALPK
jgi:hypothetical protein